LRTLLVIGGTGLVGSKVAMLAPRFNYKAYSSLPNSHALDITNHEATLSLVDEIGPDAIVNTAALHNVD